MTDNTTHRDIRHEMADVIALLGDEYTVTNVECDPGDTAIKITRQNNNKIMYIIAYSNPTDTELRLYDEDNMLATQYTMYNGQLDEYTPEEIADYIIKNL
jgi:hypothetical protein